MNLEQGNSISTTRESEKIVRTDPVRGCWWRLSTVCVLLMTFVFSLAAGPHSKSLAQDSNPTIQLTSATEAASQGDSDQQSLRPIADYTLEDIELLIIDLDSKKFVKRESATIELIRLGEKSIKPLAVHFFRGSAEANWRIKRTLEAVSTSGDESVFLKSAGILQLLYGSQNRDIQNQIVELQQKWRATRRAEAIQELQSLNFKVESTSRNYVQQRLFAGEAIYVDGMKMESELGDSSSTEKTKHLDPHSNRRDTILKIEKILSNSADDNRRIVLNQANDFSKVDPMKQLLARRAEQLVNVSVVVPENWTADENSLNLLLDVEPISQLTFVDQKLAAGQLKFVNELAGLGSLTLKNCQFDEQALKNFEIPETVQFVSLVQMPLRESLVSKLKKVQILGLEDCQIDGVTVGAIDSLSNVRSMSFVDIEFNEENFNQILRRPELGYVTFSQCKFRLDWLRKIQSDRRELTVQGTPKAFLGVQGPVDVSRDGMTGCKISRVIENSGASNGGMEIGDIITALDDQNVDRFTEVRLLIAQKRPGDKLKVKVRRGTKTIDLDITLGGMDSAPR
jgi:hypothetical protein